MNPMDPFYALDRSRPDVPNLYQLLLQQPLDEAGAKALFLRFSVAQVDQFWELTSVCGFSFATLISVTLCIVQWYWRVVWQILEPPR